MSNGLINSDYTRDFEKKPEEEYEKWLEPAIYIGLGGFGCNTVRTVKRIVGEHIGNKLIKSLGFIGLDTHPYEPQDILTREEYVELSVGALPTELAKNHPRFLDWYLNLTKKWNATSIEGANMVRAVGRLSFVNPPAHTSFMNALRGIYNQISEYKDVNRLMIYIISSIAGGTGSGMLLDVFTSVREYINPILGGQAKIQAYLASPEPLENEASPINLPNFYANAYATFKEMYYLAEGNMFTVRYAAEFLDDTINVSSIHMPNSTFLISNGNEYDKKIVERFQELGQLLATYLLLDILTPLNQLAGSPEIHRGENSIRDKIGNNNMFRVVSSLGTSRFGFPFEEVIDYFNYSIIDYCLDNELLFQKDIIQDSRQWIIDSEIAEYRSDALQHRLLKTYQGDLFTIILNLENDFEDVKREKLMRRATELIQGKEKAIVQQVDALIKQNYEILSNKVKDSFIEKLNELVNGNSIGNAYQFILSTLGEVKIHLNSLQEEIKETQDSLQKESENLKNAIANIGIAAESGFFGRKDRIRAATGAFQMELQTYLNLKVMLNSQETGIQLYNRLINFVNSQQKRYEALVKTLKARKKYIENKFYALQNLLERLSDKYNRKLGNRFSFAKVFHINELYRQRFDEDTMDTITNQLKKKLRENGTLMNQFIQDKEWVEIVSKWTIPEIEAKMNDINMIELFKKFYSEEEQKELLSFLASISSPLFPLNPTLRENSYQTIWILAGEDSIRDQFIEIFRPFISPDAGVQLASSKSKYEIIIYTVRHGYTLHSNSRSTTYAANYNRLQKQYIDGIKLGRAVPPIHCFPDAWRWNEIYPTVGEREGKLYFILGRALSHLFPSHLKEDGTPDERRNKEFIYNRGRFYHILDENDREILLGDGLDEALEAFISRRDLIEIIKTKIETKIQTEGANIIQPKLTEYSKLTEEDIDKSSGEKKQILKDLKRELEHYIKEMQTTVV